MPVTRICRDLCPGIGRRSERNGGRRGGGAAAAGVNAIGTNHVGDLMQSARSYQQRSAMKLHRQPPSSPTNSHPQTPIHGLNPEANYGQTAPTSCNRTLLAGITPIQSK